MKEKIAEQFRKPKGFWGRIVGLLMKKMNRPFYVEIINKLKITDNDKVLEIGYGHGEALKLIGEMNKKCTIAGIDFSELMYNQALKNNHALVREDRLDLQYGDFNLYNFGNKRYTKVFCVNVIYFWDDLITGFKKVSDILEPVGIYAIYMASADDLMKIQFARTDVFNKYSIEQVKDSLSKAGFRKVEVGNYHGHKEHGYIILASI